MAEQENEKPGGYDRVEKVAELKRGLKGPVRVIEQYEAAKTEEEKEKYEDAINKAYHDRDFYREEIRKVGTPAGSRDFGHLHVEWKVTDPNDVVVRLDMGGGAVQERHLTADKATSSPEHGLYAIERFSFTRASGTIQANFPQGDGPGWLSIMAIHIDGRDNEVLAAW